MALIYEEGRAEQFGGVDLSRVNATKVYLGHYSNQLYLHFMQNNGTREEKRQADKELIICERKMKYWEKHHNFDSALAVAGMAKAKKEWRL